jgi:hypothetical protein
MPLSERPKIISWFVQIYSKQIRLELWMETDPDLMPPDDPAALPTAEEAEQIEAQKQAEIAR